MKMVTVLFITAALAGSAVCFGQGASEIPIESADVAVGVAQDLPDEVQLPPELEDMFDRLFDPNQVFVADPLHKTLADYARVYSSNRRLIATVNDRVNRRQANIIAEIYSRLRDGLASGNLEIRRRSALALHAFGDNSGVPVMIEAMSAADPNDTTVIVIALRKMKDPRATSALIKAVDDENPHTRCIAAEALGELRATEAYDVLVKHVNDKEQAGGADVRMFPAESAIFALGEIGDRKAVPFLIKALQDESLGDEAVAALEKIRLGPRNFASLGRGQKAFGADIEKWTDWWNWENLDGTEVMVRLYPDCEIDPTAWETVTVKVKNHSIRFKDIDAGDNSILALVEDDQTNQLIRRCLKNRIYAWPIKENTTISIPRYDSPPIPDKYWFFDDALGNTITDATVGVWLSKYKGPKIRIAEITSDGSFKVPGPQSTLRNFEFVVFHPDYGIANASAPFSSESHIPLPLVHRTSPAAERAISGVIVDPGGNPIEGAAIKSRSVRTLGEGLINAKNDRCTAISDADGRFRTYMPASKQYAENRGKLIPPKSRYSVRIEAPKELGLLPFVGQIENGRHTTVVMDSPGNLHNLVFVDEYGVIDEQAGLEKINLIIDMEGDRKITLSYSDFKDRRLFPNGTYVAQMRAGWRQNAYFGKIHTDPVEITDDSPQEIVLSIPEPVTYTGRVVNGATGEPFPAAYVITIQSGRSGRLADITSEQWAAIHQLADDVSATDPAVKPINDAYEIGVITRTDAEGYYAIQPQPGRKLYIFLAFDENFIPVSKRMYLQKPGDPREAAVETLQLFPAAKILVQPCVEEERVSITPKWIVNEAASPVWVRDLLKLDNPRTRPIKYAGWIKQNEPHYVFVPADTTLQLQLRTPYDTQWSPFTTEESFRLGHGEVLDIGKIDLQPSLKVYITLVNSAGEPVEGVPVRLLVGNLGGAPNNSDENGRVVFHFPPYTGGKFYVSDYRLGISGSGRLREELPFQLAGEEDNETEFTLQLSDEILDSIFE